MGFGCCFWGSLVPSQYTVPGNLYSKNDRIDRKKLRRLINDGKLAPLFPGCEEAHPPPEHDQYAAVLTRLLRRKGHMETTTLKEHMLLLGQAYEACPICFLHYPALNTSRCCAKRVCTECYLQVQTARSGVPACPFCKLPNYSAKFLGLKSGEEREQERIEEQKVIEARIREREEEVRRDQEREQQRRQQPAATAAAAAAGGSRLPATGMPVGIMAASGAAASLSLPAGALVATGVPSSPTASSDTWQSAAEARSPTHAAQQHGAVASAARSPQEQPPNTSAQAHGQSPRHMRHWPGQQAPQQDPHSRPPGNHPHGQYPVNTRVQHRHAQGVGHAGAYRWADYVPMGVVDMGELGVEDINDLMLEQAMYESIAASSGAAAASAAVAASRARVGLPVSMATANTAGGSTGSIDRQEVSTAQPTMHPGQLPTPPHAADDSSTAIVAGMPGGDAPVLDSANTQQGLMPESTTAGAASSTSTLGANVPTASHSTGLHQPLLSCPATARQNDREIANTHELLSEHQQLQLAIKLSLADTGQAGAAAAATSGSSSTMAIAAHSSLDLQQPAATVMAQGIPAVGTPAQAAHSLLEHDGGLHEELTSKRAWHAPVLGMPALHLPVGKGDGEDSNSCSAGLQAGQLQGSLLLQREQTPDTPISPHLPVAPVSGTCGAGNDCGHIVHDADLTGRGVTKQPGGDAAGNAAVSVGLTASALPGHPQWLGNHAGSSTQACAGPIAESTEASHDWGHAANTWLVANCQTAVQDTHSHFCVDAALSSDRQSMASYASSSEPSAASVAASMPQQLHLGMAFVVWDAAVTAGLNSQAGRTATTHPPVAISGEASRSAPRPLLLVQNPDGSNLCAVPEESAVSEPSQPASIQQQQQQEDDSDQLFVDSSAQFDSMAAQLVAAQDMAVGNEVQAIQAAAYADYDVPQQSPLDNGDALLTAHILAMDMRLKKTYASGS